MIGYEHKLSSRALKQEAKWGVSSDSSMRKDWTPETGRVSFQNNDNFRTNQVTVADHMDRISAGSAVGLAATWACVNLIAGTNASLPLMVYLREGNVRKVARDHPLYFLLHDSPNFDQTSVDFWEFMNAGIELRGNAYAEVERRSNGEVISLTPISPDLVRTRRNSDGQIEYRWNAEGDEVTRLQEHVLHVRGFGGNPLGGASPLTVCRQTFTSAAYAEAASGNMFANGVRPSGVLSTARGLNLEQRKVAEQLLVEKFQGAMNAGRPMLLDDGMTWTQITLSPEDAQMLETRRFSVEEICRIFGVPPHMIGHTENSTSWGTGLEQQTLAFQKFTLRRRLKRIEQALEKQLLSRSERMRGYSIEFNLDGLLRGDSAGRADFYTKMTQIGGMTINEVRALENLPPVPGGDVPRMQMQNVPIDNSGQENPK